MLVKRFAVRSRASSYLHTYILRRQNHKISARGVPKSKARGYPRARMGLPHIQIVVVIVVSGPKILVGAKSFTKLEKQLIGFITTQKVDIITIDHETSGTSDGSDTKFGQPRFGVYKQSVHVVNIQNFYRRSSLN